jgi:hypothetical protein
MNNGWFGVMNKTIAWNAFETIKFNNKLYSLEEILCCIINNPIYNYMWLIVICDVFIIFTISHHPFQSFTIIVTIVQLICDY